MNISPLLQSIKTQYETMYKKEAFKNNKPTMEFVEAMARSHDKHKKNFIGIELQLANSLATIHEELEK